MFGLVPFGSRKELRREDPFRRLFDCFNEPFFSQDFFAPFSHEGVSSFHVDVRDLKDRYELAAELPGVKKEDIHIRYENNYLTIEARKEAFSEEKDKDGNYIRRECSTGSMSRSFYIDGIDEDKVDASFENGMLKVSMPKAAEVLRSKDIPIRWITNIFANKPHDAVRLVWFSIRLLSQ